MELKCVGAAVAGGVLRRVGAFDGGQWPEECASVGVREWGAPAQHLPGGWGRQWPGWCATEWVRVERPHVLVRACAGVPPLYRVRCPGLGSGLCLLSVCM